MNRVNSDVTHQVSSEIAIESKVDDRCHTQTHDDSKSWYRLRCYDNDVCDRHRSHETPTRNTAPGNASPSSVTPMKRVGVRNLPTGVDSILLPQTTSISTASVASPNTVRTTVTATDSSFTVDIDNDLDNESGDTLTTSVPHHANKLVSTLTK